MRIWLSGVLRSLTVVCLGLAASVPVVVVSAQSAGAYLGPVVGCAFHLGAIGSQGAAGTVYYSALIHR